MRDSKSKVFLSYAAQDAPTAHLLAMRLQDAGVHVWAKDVLVHGESWNYGLQKELRASDYIIFLVSRAALESKYWAYELNSAKNIQELSDRSIILVPILLEDVDLPNSIKGLHYIDFRLNPREAVNELVYLFQDPIDIDFSILSPKKFEDLIADLLKDLSSDMERDVNFRGVNYDYKVTFNAHNIFGANKNETWYIEAKHYSSGRLSVALIKDFAARTHVAFSDHKLHVALVTSSQITSAAREILKDIPIRVVEGVELKRILLNKKDIVSRYFGAQRLW